MNQTNRAFITATDGVKEAISMANITRFDPVSEMISLRSAMDRLFEDSFVSPVTWRTIAGGEAVAPALDVHETADEIVVTAALPGMKAEDVEITMTGQNLTLRGEFKADDEVKRDQYLVRERRYGSFHRSIQLPMRVEGSKAEATFADGVLTLRIPKSEEVKPRQIRISAGTGDPIETPENGEAS
ncbi:MAG: Hsp20/alpha crystallin family protein [Candidatus Limnocylindria bacterium]